ncbi:MAG: SDR family oxidoreductase [Burkholderiaceae bacterium]
MKPSKVVIVTGAGRGIGAAAAVELARAGLTPVLFVRSPDAAKPVADAVRQAGAADCSVQACDVADSEQVAAAVARTLERHSALHALVNNAGQVDPIGRLSDTDPAQWRRAFEVNLFGAYHMVHAVLPAMVAAGGGYVLNLSSGAAHTARIGWSAYCGSKAALWMLTRSIVAEYESDGIVATGLQPGFVDTEMQGKIRRAGLNEISKLRREDLAPAANVGRAIAWLCDQVPRQFHGLDITINDVKAAAGTANLENS